MDVTLVRLARWLLLVYQLPSNPASLRVEIWRKLQRYGALALPSSGPRAGGVGHRGEDCTFETLRKEFGIRDRKVKRIAEIIHDADLGDEKFGRREGLGLDTTLKGWASQDVADDELLRRGMELIEGLYYGL